MDADIAAAFANLTAQINALAIEIQGLKGGSGGNANPHPTHAAPIPYSGPSEDWQAYVDMGTLKFTRDYWILGRPGAQSGVNLGLWGSANQMLSMMGESKPHLSIVCLVDPQPDGGNWQQATKSAADAGWIDGSKYLPDPSLTGGQRAAAWDAAGRPSVSADGFLLQRGGDYVTNASGQKVPPGADPGFKVG